MGWLNKLLNGLKISCTIISSSASSWQLTDCSTPSFGSGVHIFQYVVIWMMTYIANYTELVGVADMTYGKT